MPSLTQEVSGYIDLGQRLAGNEAGMVAAFGLEARLLPQPTDLSCLNWTSNRLDSCSSANFEASRASYRLGSRLPAWLHGAAGRCQQQRAWHIWRRMLP